MVDITKRLAAHWAEIDRIKTQLATPTAKAEQRAELFRELVITRQEYGLLLRIARSRRTLIYRVIP